MKEISKAKWPAAAVLAALACIAFLPAFARAAGLPGETADPAKSLLEKASKALGEDRPWTTRVEKGLHIEWDTEGWGTLKADYTRSIKKPDKLKIDRDNSAYDHPFFRTYYYNGDDAWYVTNLNPGRNPQVTASMKNLLERVDGIAFYLAACDTFFTASAAPDDTLLPGAELLRAGCVLKGDTTLFDVDAKTHLLRRRVENKGARVSIFEDYRKDDGRMVPYHVTVYDAGKKTNEFVWEKITFESSLDDAIFEENRPPKQ
jgi:outer membrane lipoprotein-sorting protein